MLIPTKLGTEHPWVKGIQLFLNKGPGLFPLGDNNEIASKHIDEIFKSSSQEPQGQFQPNLTQSILGEEHSTFFK